MKKPLQQLEIEHREFLVEFANAVLLWQHIEEQVFMIYVAAIRAKDINILAASFHSVVNFVARAKMVDSAMQIAIETSPLLVIHPSFLWVAEAG